MRLTRGPIPQQDYCSPRLASRTPSTATSRAALVRPRASVLFLDPVADKLIVAVALVLLVSKDPRALIVLTAAITIGREIAVSALREWMAEIGQRRKVAVSQLGKYKTTLQIIGLSMMLYRRDLVGLPTYLVGVAFTVLAAILTLSSMVTYLRVAWPELRR